MNVSLTFDFSKVTFHDIPESYGIAETVTLQFTIANDHEPNAKDWIGLYRVGWKSIKEYVTYEWINLPGGYKPGIEAECVCTLNDDLPRNDEDFFQFCYINSHSKVCGASSPFQFLEDYDIVVIGETDSMLIVETNNAGCPLKQPTATQQQQCQPSTDQELVVAKDDEVERITEELTETKTLLVERDSQLKDLGSEVNQLRSKLKESEDMSIQLTSDVNRLKSELSDAKETNVSIEKSFCEREKRHDKMLLEFSEKELAYKEKEKQLNVTLQDTQKQLCQKAQEFELLKMDHSSNVTMLDIKQRTIEGLTKRCSKMSTEMSQMKKLMGKEKAAVPQEQIRHHHQSSTTDENWTNHVALEKQDFAFHRNSASAELATDGVEDLIGRSAVVGAEIEKESSVNKVETDDSCSTDQFHDDDDGGVLQSRRTCKVCFLTFPVGTSVHIIRDHLQSHQKVCPVCNMNFELNCTQPEFEMHVSSHLADTIICADGRKICPMCDLEFPPAWAQDQFEVHVNQHFTDTLRPW